MENKILNICLLLISCLGCQSTEPSAGFSRVVKDPIQGARISWDYNTIEQLSEWGGYPRLRRLQDQSLIAVYDSGGNAMMRRSFDNGETWGEAVIVFGRHIYTNSQNQKCDINIANSEIYQLSNGDLIFGCNYRPVQDGIAPFSIVVKRSSDMGQTWSKEDVIYEAGTCFADGCWEPSFLQLPSGELQVYFANESPYRNSDEQEISMLSSDDNGLNWTKKTKMVSYRAGKRDGMPTAILLDDEIVVSIEDNQSASFKPYTVRSNIGENWSEPVLGNSLARTSALQDFLPDFVYAGAPYLLKLPSGETMLSYQTTENRSSNWEKSTLEIAVGDNEARNFTKRTRPIDVPIDKEAKWNSISLFDENTVVALTSSNFRGDRIGVWMVKGYILNNLKLKKTKDLDHPNLFVGGKGDANVRAWIYYSDEALHVQTLVFDKYLYKESATSPRVDRVIISLDNNNASLLEPDKGIFRISCTYDGILAVEEGETGIWKNIPAGRIIATSELQRNGYQIEFTIPFESINKMDKERMRINLTLSAYKSAYIGYLESLPNSQENASNTWIELSFE